MKDVTQTQGAKLAAEAPGRGDYTNATDLIGWVLRVEKADKTTHDYGKGNGPEERWEVIAAILGRVREPAKFADDAPDAPRKIVRFSITSDAGITLAGMAPDDFPFKAKVVTVNLAKGRRTMALVAPDAEEKVSF